MTTPPIPSLNFSSPAMSGADSMHDGTIDFKNTFQGSSIVIGNGSSAGSNSNGDMTLVQKAIYIGLGGVVVAFIMKVLKK